jgi:hypothetical protein
MKQDKSPTESKRRGSGPLAHFNCSFAANSFELKRKIAGTEASVVTEHCDSCLRSEPSSFRYIDLPEGPEERPRHCLRTNLGLSTFVSKWPTTPGSLNPSSRPLGIATGNLAGIGRVPERGVLLFRLLPEVLLINPGNRLALAGLRGRWKSHSPALDGPISPWYGRLKTTLSIFWNLSAQTFK